MNYHNNGFFGIDNYNRNTSFDRILTPKIKHDFNNMISNIKTTRNMNNPINKNFLGLNNNNNTISRAKIKKSAFNSKEKNTHKAAIADISHFITCNTRLKSNFKTLKSAANLSREFINNSFDYTNNRLNTICETSVSDYLQRRHNQSQQKIMKIKNEKMMEEIKELRDKPRISANSRKILENNRGSDPSENVFDRLTNKSYDRKKALELKKLEEINNKNTEKPKVSNKYKQINYITKYAEKNK